MFKLFRKSALLPILLIAKAAMADGLIDQVITEYSKAYEVATHEGAVLPDSTEALEHFKILVQGFDDESQGAALRLLQAYQKLKGPKLSYQQQNGAPNPSERLEVQPDSRCCSCLDRFHSGNKTEFYYYDSPTCGHISLANPGSVVGSGTGLVSVVLLGKFSAIGFPWILPAGYAAFAGNYGLGTGIWEACRRLCCRSEKESHLEVTGETAVPRQQSREQMVEVSSKLEDLKQDPLLAYILKLFFEEVPPLTEYCTEVEMSERSRIKTSEQL